MPTNELLRATQHIGFMPSLIMSEQPGISVPCGFTAGGLSIWLQIAGHRFADLQVLGVARAFERTRRPLRLRHPGRFRLVAPARHEGQLSVEPDQARPAERSRRAPVARPRIAGPRHTAQ